MKWKKQLFALITCGLAIFFAMLPIASTDALGEKASQNIDPNNFVRQIDNEFFPLQPGTTFYYRGESEGVPTREEMFVTRETKQILGVTCTIVHARSFEDGVLVEDTFDYYAQDKDGNVWYYGEDTKELDENGNVISTEGSWLAGVDGAQPGIIMEANPRKGDRYQQEVAPGVAEDMAQVISLDESICVRYGCFDDVLMTKEWSPLEKGVVENKYYAKGVGFIFGVMVKGGDEQIELVRVRH
jgi:hypothetical protein